MSAPAALSAVIIDCADPAALAAFYRQVTGWDVTDGDDDFVYLGDGPVQLGQPGQVGGHGGPARLLH